jgi:hypothetical protein
MNKKSVKYLQSINFLQLTLAKKTGNKNVGHTAPKLVISVIIKQNTNLCEKI